MISAVVLTKNEEKNIIDCINSLQWCDEIVVIDDFSEDRTVELLEEQKNKKIRIFGRHLSLDFAAQRNFGLEKASGDWVLFVDADERISVSLQYEIVGLIHETIENYSGYSIRRTDTIWGRTLRFGEVGGIKLLRLGRKNSGKWTGHVHETWKINGKVGELKNAILHYPHQSISEFLHEINFYTDIRAKELFDKKTKAYWLSVILYPKVKFLQNYLFKLGFLDGIPGLIIALLMSLHSFLVRGKLWLLWQKKGK